MSTSGIESINRMSKPQLYELMLQMKTLIEQDGKQAKQILIDNPMLTKALFQAQIILGMVKPRSPEAQSPPPPPEQAEQKPNVQHAQQLPIQPGYQGQSTTSPRKQTPPQLSSISVPTASLPSPNIQPQVSSDSLYMLQQDQGYMNAQVSSASIPHSSQIHNVRLPPPPPNYLIPQPQQQAPGLFNQHMQPPLPQQSRPPPMQPVTHQLHQQVPNSVGFQPPNVPHPQMSQQMFHSGNNTPSFQQGRPSMPSHLQSQQFYQNAPHMDSEYQPERGVAHRTPNFQDNDSSGAHHSVQRHPHPAQPPRPPPLTSEMEQALLRQVMSISPEQISLLPPDQRQQIIQLREMLRQL